jgi:hypothetical protein
MENKNKDRDKKKTIIELALRQFKENLRAEVAKVNLKRQYSSEYVTDKISLFNDIFKSYAWLIIFGLGLIICPLCLTVFADSSLQAWGNIKNAVFYWGLACGIYVFIIYLGVHMLNATIKYSTPVVMFSPFIFWIPICVVCQFFIVVLKMLLLIPLTVLVVGSRINQLYRRIFHVCPYRECSYRGYPIHVCPECGADNHYLWPNLYGLLKHECVNCDAQLPTIYRLGRQHLVKRCGRCKMQLIGKHAGRIPVRQIGIIGGAKSGKTNYLLMAIDQIMAGQDWIQGKIDDPDQARVFANDWSMLERGIPAEKSLVIQQAYMLYTKINGIKNQVYLYDSPGEDYESISGMSVHQYFGMMEGFILMVDPETFCVGNDAERHDNLVRFYAVVNSALQRLLQEKHRGGEKINMRAAIIIAKADMPWVINQIGDVRNTVIPGDICRSAIINWGCNNLVMGFENHFEEVQYFACSALGRDKDLADNTAFEGFRLLEPLQWLLT